MGPMSIPHVSPSRIQIFEPPSDTADLRLKHLIRPYDAKSAQIGLIGVPSDLGVIAGGGRGGARLGPDAIRGELRRYGTAYNFESDVDLSALSIVDVGNLEVDEAPTEIVHQRLTEAVSAMIAEGMLPVVLGGGHDLTFAGVRGLLQDSRREKFGGIALDAHFDVREVAEGKITSGTPFRRILDELKLPGEAFVEIGGNGSVNAKAHFDYLIQKESRIFSLHETRQKGMPALFARALQISRHRTGGIFVSIDLDAVAQSYAPGVSAPSPEGLTPEEAAQAALLAGEEPKVRYFDIMELNPIFDHDNRTARLAVAILHAFLCGVARRTRQTERGIGFRPKK
jgi:formimidoylglutamase